MNILGAIGRGIKTGCEYTARFIVGVITLGWFGTPRAKSESDTYIELENKQKKLPERDAKKQLKEMVTNKIDSQASDRLLEIRKEAKKNPNNLELQAAYEKLKFLELKGDWEMAAFVESKDIRKQEDIAEINAELDKVIATNLKKIEDPIQFEVERSNTVAELLINDSGEINFFLIKSLKDNLPPSASPIYEAQFQELLDTLQKEGNKGKMAKTLLSINIPNKDNTKATNIIKVMFKLGVDDKLQPKDARRAALSALLMDLRQSATGSCFTTSFAISIHDSQPEQFLQDIKEMIEQGFIERKYNGETIKFVLSDVPVEEIGFKEDLENTDKKLEAAINALGIESEKNIQTALIKHIYYEKNHRFELYGRVLAKDRKPICSFDELIDYFMSRKEVKNNDKLLSIFKKIKSEENINSIPSLIERVITLSGYTIEEFTAILSNIELSNIESKSELIDIVAILFLIEENNTRFESNGIIIKRNEVPIGSFKEFINHILLKDPEILKLKGITSALEKLSKQSNVTSIETLIAELASIDFPEAEIDSFFKKLFDEYNIKETQKKPTIIQNYIETLAREKTGITENDLNDRKKLQQLSTKIHDLSNQEVYDQKVINNLINEYEQIGKRFEKENLHKKLESFDNLMNLAKIAYASVDHNLLLRGWEYGLASTGRKSSELKSPISNRYLKTDAPLVYSALWGKVPSAKGTFLGLDQKIDLLTKESNQLQKIDKNLIEEFKKRFEDLFSERIKTQYQYGGYKLYNITGITNPNEIEILADPDAIQNTLAGLILEVGVILRQENKDKLNKEQSQAIIELAEQLSNYAKTPEFYEFFVRKFANRIKPTLKSTDEVPSKENLMKFLKPSTEGGFTEFISEAYNQKKPTEINLIAKTSNTLLASLIEQARKLNIPNDPKQRLHISGGLHAFLFMPNHPSFRNAVDSSLTPDEWIQEYVINQGQTIVFADTNWESAGKRRFFGFKKNDKDEIVLISLDESGKPLAGIDEMGTTQMEMNQKEWIKEHSWHLTI